MAVPNDKRALRTAFMEKRKEAAALHGETAGPAMAKLFLAHFSPKPGEAVAGYMPMRNEADPLPLLAALHEKGVATALPRIEAREGALGFYAWAPGDPLIEGPFGTKEPSIKAAHVVPGILIVPLLAFDSDGGRLGYGGGFYDRTLEELRLRHRVMAVGLAFSAQQAENLPTEPHDAVLDAVVTEKAVLFFR